MPSKVWDEMWYSDSNMYWVGYEFQIIIIFKLKIIFLIHHSSTNKKSLQIRIQKHIQIERQR